MDELLRAGFAALGLPLDAAALARFQTYYTLLDERSKVMNLTAIHGETDVAQLHFLDSAALLTVEPLAGKSVIDVGTGAGFPGLPLKIAQPDISLTLLDSLDKRVRFLGDVCAAAGLTDVTCLHARAEEAPELRGQFDAAVCIAGFVHLRDDELSRGFRLLAGLLPEPGAGWRKPLFLRC